MSDLVTAAASMASANGQDHITLMGLKMQKQAEQLVVSLIDQGTAQVKALNQQPALSSSGPKGTQVNLSV
ncbi:MAG: hypothetical protein HQL44_15810 [Alphaproteobacteria bacterium]|nr:hypothetical protein [Alphaproteobacteria bacterium]